MPICFPVTKTTFTNGHQVVPPWEATTQHSTSIDQLEPLKYQINQEDQNNTKKSLKLKTHFRNVDQDPCANPKMQLSDKIKHLNRTTKHNIRKMTE